MVDLNTLIPTGSGLQLTFAVAINDAGQIAGFGVPAGCAAKDVDLCGHAYVLIPCDEHRSSVDGCAESRVDASTVPAAQPVLREACVVAARPSVRSPCTWLMEITGPSTRGDAP